MWQFPQILLIYPCYGFRRILLEFPRLLNQSQVIVDTVAVANLTTQGVAQYLLGCIAFQLELTFFIARHIPRVLCASIARHNGRVYGIRTPLLLTQGYLVVDTIALTILG